MVKNSSLYQNKHNTSLYSDFFSLNFLKATIDIFESIDEALLIVDKSSTIKYINESATHLLQINKEEVIEKKICDILSADVKAIFKQLCDQLSEDKKQSTIIKEYIPSLKNWLHVQAYSTSDGTAFLFRHDEIKDQAAIMMEKYYRALFDDHPDPICLIDLGGHVLSANLSFRDFFQVSNEELPGKKFYYFITESKQKKAIGLLAHAENGETKSIQINLSEEFGYPYYIIVTAIPIQVNRHIFGAYIMIKDITDDQKNLEEIRQLYMMNRLVTESVQDGILGLDKNYNVIMWNKAAKKMTGYDKEDVTVELMQKFMKQFDKNDLKIIDQWTSNQCKGTENMVIERSGATLYRKDGIAFLCEYTITPMVYNGDVIGSVITFRDISEKKKSEELLRQSEKLSAVGQLAAGIAHEIRNPLTSLKGFLQLIEINKGGKKEYFDIMKAEFGRIENILNELLILSKPQIKEKSSTNLHQLLNSTVILLRTQAIIKDIEIVTSFPVEIMYISCIEHQIKQVLINIIKNAIESMNHGGQITASLEKEEDWAKITISDEGCGMSPESIEKMRHPFYTTKETGTGLGLMVTFQLIEEHGGKIKIESELGKGTDFIIYLPIDSSSEVDYMI